VSDAVVITVAPTGTEVTRANNPNVPYTAAEIVEESVRAGSAGAGVVHVHVRDDDGTPSADQAKFKMVISQLRQRSAMLTCASTGGAVGMSLLDRLAGAHADPDAVGVETGSLNFGETPFITTPAETAEVVRVARSYGKPLEVEAFDTGHVVAGASLVESGALPVGTPFNLVFGVPGGAPPSASALFAMVAHLPEGSPWTITAIGRHQTPMLLRALLMDAPGIRVGFEDNVYLKKGVLARSNAELVAHAVHLAELVGRRPAAADECRAYFGLVEPVPAPGTDAAGD
jgi:3-keto-5-aminohexanoate cleavage enzyme